MSVWMSFCSKGKVCRGQVRKVWWGQMRPGRFHIGSGREVWCFGS